MEITITINQYQIEKLLEAQREFNRTVEHTQDLSSTLSRCLEIGIREFTKSKFYDDSER